MNENENKLKKSIESIIKLRNNDTDIQVKDEMTRFLEMNLRSNKITEEEYEKMLEYIDYAIKNRNKKSEEKLTSKSEIKESDSFKKLREAAKKLNEEEYESEKEYIEYLSKINEEKMKKLNNQVIENNESKEISEQDMKMIDAIIMYKGELGKKAPERKDDGEER